MKVLITGAGGTLGASLEPMLAELGHEPVLLDVSPSVSGPRTLVCDVRRMDDVRRAMEGVDFVVHAAAIHGIHLRDHSAQDFYDLNLTGTFNTWEAAIEAGVKGVVFSSTMGVYGESRTPPSDDAVVELDEETPLLAGDIYGLTKVLGEEMCRYHLRAHGVPSVALRYGMFVPEPFWHAGIRLLYGGVDVRDVAGAVVAVMDALVDGRVTWDAYNVESLVPFTQADGPQLRTDPLLVLDRHYPGSEALLRERGVQRLNPITNIYPMRRIEERLGFRPRHNFGEWLEGLRSRPGDMAPAESPWW